MIENEEEAGELIAAKCKKAPEMTNEQALVLEEIYETYGDVVNVGISNAEDRQYAEDNFFKYIIYPSIYYPPVPPTPPSPLSGEGPSKKGRWSSSTGRTSFEALFSPTVSTADQKGSP